MIVINISILLITSILVRECGGKVNRGGGGSSKATLSSFQTCSAIDDCKDLQNSFCNVAEAKCECLPSHLPITDPNDSDQILRCVPIANKIDEPCEILKQCTEKLEYSFCHPTAKRCECNPDAVASSNREKCLLGNVPIEGSCVEDQQCVGPPGSSWCDSGFCSCKQPDFVASNDKNTCLKANIPIGDECRESQQCVGPNSHCSGNTCMCDKEYVHSPNLQRCLEIVKELEGDCQDTIQCVTGAPGNHSVCISKDPNDPNLGKVCRCDSDSINAPEQHRCHKKAQQLGESCEIQNQCITTIGEYSWCNNNGVCDCQSSYVGSSDRKRCLQVKDINDICIDPTQCSKVEHADCLNVPGEIEPPEKKCMCVDGFKDDPLIKNKCHRLAAKLGETCRDSPVQCNNINLARCVESLENPQIHKTCQCPDPYLENGNRTKCLSYVEHLNGTCEETRQCLTTNSECVEVQVIPGNIGRQCRCRPNEYVASTEIANRCIPILKEINLNCMENVQCTAGIGPLSECRDSVCQCKISYGYYNNECFIPAKLGQACDRVEQCFVAVSNLTMCSSTTPGGIKRCSCRPPSETVDEKCFDPTKRVGGTCQSNDECTYAISGEVQCDWLSRTCECKFGYKPDFSGVWCSGSGLLQGEFIYLLGLVLAYILMISV